MIKIFFILAMFLFIPNASAKQVDIHLFYSDTCVHCKQEIEFLNEFKKENDVNIITYEVTKNSENSNLLDDVKEKLKEKNKYVPYTVIGTTGITAFSDTQKNQIIKAYNKYSNEEYVDIVNVVKNDLDVDYKINPPDGEFILPILGYINPRTVSLPFVSILIGLVDGFNPCAMWVLLFLLSIIITMKDHKKMWIIGLTFISTSALVYLGFMLAWLHVAISLTQVNWVRFIIAIIALLGGLFNISSYFKSLKDGDGCQIVDKNQRKSVINKVNKIVSQIDSKKTFVLAILGVMGLAVSVNLIELACSSGLPLVFTQVLAYNNLNNFEYIIYLLIYVLFFMLDDIMVFFITMKTFNLKGISTKYNKYSHLVGGIIMLFIGFLLIFKPDWLMFNF